MNPLNIIFILFLYINKNIYIFYIIAMWEGYPVAVKIMVIPASMAG